jgi:hypothetical protein
MCCGPARGSPAGSAPTTPARCAGRASCVTSPLAQGTEVLLTLFERLQRDPEAEAFHAPAVLDGREYNKADFKYGPNVIGADVVGWLHDGLTRYWRYPCGDSEATVLDRLPRGARRAGRAGAARHLERRSLPPQHPPSCARASTRPSAG